jgi:UDP-hydrolysing UDP-N-acetyl-D-glucosamine 2-epimerase
VLIDAGKVMRAAVVVGGRADYALQLPVMRCLRRRGHDVLLVCSEHLRDGIGDDTQPTKDGFAPHATLGLEMPDDTATSRAVAVGAVIGAVAQYLAAELPDVVVVYGDRQEAFGAAVAASQVGVPIAHLEGGDITEGGCNDDALRHAITKLAHLHFPTNAESAARVVSMGEEPWRVRCAGFTGAEYAYDSEHASSADVLASLGIPRGSVVVTFVAHAVAAESHLAGWQGAEAVRALTAVLAEWSDVYVVVLEPNADHGGLAMLESLVALVEHPRVVLRRNLGGARYRGLLAHMGANHGVLVGNSSSGIKEAGLYGCPAVNIGVRQRGRMRNDVLVEDVDWRCADITDATLWWSRMISRREEGKAAHPYAMAGVRPSTAIVETVEQALVDRERLMVKRWRGEA